MTKALIDYEEKILRELNGEPQEGLSWGAAMSVSLEHLSNCGYVTRGPTYDITDKGRQYLKEQAA